MKMFRCVIILCTLLLVGCSDGGKEPEGEKPYGHPDELKDTTRLDPAKAPAPDSASHKATDSNRGPRYR